MHDEMEIMDKLIADMEAGIYEPDDKLPSENDLARLIKVAVCGHGGDRPGHDLVVVVLPGKMVYGVRVDEDAAQRDLSRQERKGAARLHQPHSTARRGDRLSGQPDEQAAGIYENYVPERLLYVRALKVRVQRGFFEQPQTGRPGMDETKTTD